MVEKVPKPSAELILMASFFWNPPVLTFPISSNLSMYRAINKTTKFENDKGKLFDN